MSSAYRPKPSGWGRHGLNSRSWKRASRVSVGEGRPGQDPRSQRGSAPVPRPKQGWMDVRGAITGRKDLRVPRGGHLSVPRGSQGLI
eukprot:gene4678-biopygen618